MAKASEKVGVLLAYQAVCRMGSFLRRVDWCASKVTSENKPNKAGVVRAMALFDHCR